MNRRAFLKSLLMGGTAAAATLLFPGALDALAKGLPFGPLPRISQELINKLRHVRPLSGVSPVVTPTLTANANLEVGAQTVAGASGPAVTTQSVTLPRNLLTNAGALIEDFENAAQWAVFNGTVANDTADKVTGHQSLLVTTSSTDTAIIDKPETYSLATSQMVQWSFYCHDASITDIWGLYAMLPADLNWDQYFEADLPNDYSLYYTRSGSWNTVRVLRSDFTNENGGDSWTTPRTDVALGVLSSVAGCKTSFDDFRSNVVPLPAVMLSFDDGPASVFTQAYQYAVKHGVRATAYVVTNWVGQSGYLSVAQMQQMAANGWAIGNHTSDHTQLATVDQATAQTKLRTARQKLESWGLGAAARHVAYPNDSWNATVLAAMRAEGMLSGRTTEAAPHFMPDNPLLIPCRTLEWGASLSDAKAMVNRTIARGELLVVYTHGLESSESLSWNWDISDYQGFIDYIVAKKLPTINILDFYDLMSGSVRVTLPH